MASSLTYVRFNPHIDMTLIGQLVKCYQEVFAETPWNEWKKCSVCGHKWGISHIAELQYLEFRHCGAHVVDFWPEDVVQADLFHEITPEASCWLALNGENVIGFCWGYPITTEALELKLDFPGLAERIHEFVPARMVAYQDDLGVTKEWRGCGIARELFRLRLQDYLERGFQLGVIRTKMNPPSVTYTWFKRLGYHEIAHYADADQRVILVRSLHDLCI